MSVIEEDILIKTNIQEKENIWNKSSITPGTNFMKKLNKSYILTIQKKILNKLNVKNIIVSGSDENGEGEHKIFEYIRNNYKKTDSNVVYGLDADLIMLCLNHLSFNNNIYLYRETPNL